MAEKYILPDPSPVCVGFPNINVYEIEINLSTPGEESKYIIVPADVEEITVTLVPGSVSSGTVFTTTDKYEKVTLDDPNIDWVEWPLGTVFAVVKDVCSKVTSIKVNLISGDSLKATIRMQ